MCICSQEDKQKNVKNGGWVIKLQQLLDDPEATFKLFYSALGCDQGLLIDCGNDLSRVRKG